MKLKKSLVIKNNSVIFGMIPKARQKILEFWKHFQLLKLKIQGSSS